MRRAVPLLAMALVLGLAMPAPASQRGGGVRILKIAFDPPGPDNGSNSRLNEETVVIVNDSALWLTLTGWSLRDRDGNVYRFPTFTLWAKERVTIHTGRGVDDETNLYWDAGGAVWDNDRDAATLRLRSGVRVDACAYTGSGSIARC